MPMDLNEILKVAIKGGASDIHLKSGLPPMFRLDGALVPLKNAERLVPEDLQRMTVGIMNPSSARSAAPPSSRTGRGRPIISAATAGLGG